MIRMNEPNVSYDQSLDACKDGIDTVHPLHPKLTSAEAALKQNAVGYRNLAVAGNLYTLRGVSGEDPVVIAGLRKSDLVSLYETYFRGKNKPGRSLYDSLLTAANEKCPYCGGIGRPRNLDHFMPKAKFPQFSVLPVNLIPSCRDCNMDGKGRKFLSTADKQIIHPFLEALHFFDEQWIFANYHAAVDSDPSYIEYFVSPPNAWSALDKARVQQHFVDFDIAKRYSIEASLHLNEIEAQIGALLKVDKNIDFKEILLHPVISSAPFANHWKRIMYISLLQYRPVAKVA
jgi:hypothetical protein